MRDLKNILAKRFGSDQVHTGKESESLQYIPFGISTQSLCVDLAIGLPGIPAGKLTQITGLDGCGKSTLVQNIMAEAQRIGGQIVLLDTEHAYDARRARAIGINTKEWVILEPDHLEQLMDMIMITCETFYKDRKSDIGKVPLLIVIDSLEGVRTKDQLQGSSEDKFVASAARVLSNALPKVQKTLAKYKASLIVVSQLITEIGTNSYFGTQYNTKGGLSLRYFASLRIKIDGKNTKTNRLYDDNDVCLGFKNVIEVLKNKSCPPFKKATYFLRFDCGIDKYIDLLDASVELELLTPGGAGYYSGKIGKHDLKFRKKEWKELVDTKFKGPDKLRQNLTKLAINKGLLKDYCYELADE
jgi:recombination protein RecA